MPGSLSPKLDWPLANPKWAATLNPVLANPLVSGLVLKDVSLLLGTNTINHRLGRELQGWVIVRNNANATFYDNQTNNQLGQFNLILIASANAVVSIYVF